MANVKISQLPAASAVSASSDVLPLVHSGVTVKATPNQLVQEVLKAPGAIGTSTPANGTFLNLTSTGNFTASGINKAINLSPTGTGSVTISPNGLLTIAPTSLGSMNNVVIGSVTPGPATFNALTLTGSLTASASTGTAGQVLSSTGTGVEWITPSVVTMVYPTAGIAVSNGSAWTTSLTAPTGALVGTTATQTLTGKTISGNDNTLSNIDNASLKNSTITFGLDPISLGGTISTFNNVSIGQTTAGAGAFTTLSASSTVSGSGFSTYLASPPAIGGTTPAAGAFTTLSASSTVSGTGFSTYLASPPAIGGTTPAAGNFTTLGATGNTTLGDAAGDTLTINAGTTTFTQGTANGVPYLNASKVLTTGTELTFDGSQLSVGTAGSTSNGLKLNSSNAGANYVLYRDGTTGLLQVYGNQTGFNGLLVSGVDGQQYLSDPSKHIWSVSGSEQMRLNSTGLGIGTSSPSVKLQVEGAANSAAVTLLRLNNSGTTGGGPGIASRISFTAGATALGYIQGSNFASGAAGLQFSGDGTNAQAILDASGNLGLGVTPDNSYNACLQLKSGITFPATQVASSNANTLDDYEEGTWTPVPAGGTTAGTYTLGDITGHYTKVGRQVTVICAIYAISFTGIGDFYITGLPFTVNASIPPICAVQFNENPFGNLLPGSSQIMGLLTANSINFRACDNDSTSGATNQLTCSASTINYLRVTATYFV